MKYIVLSFCCCFFEFSYSQVTYSALDSAVVSVVSHLTENGVQTEHYTHKSLGYYIIYRNGLVEVLSHEKQFEKTKPTPFYHPYPVFKTGISDSILNARFLNPKFDCAKGWNKQGCFIDTSNVYKPLTEVIEMRQKLGAKSSIANNHISIIEEKLVKVVLTNNSDLANNGLIMYFSFIEGRWYLSIIDRSTTDCGA